MLLGAGGSWVPLPQPEARFPFTALLAQLQSPELSPSLAALEGDKFCGSFASVGAIFDYVSK